jgi:hypothetical protein
VSWPVALDDFAAVLERAEAALADSDATIEPLVFTAPTVDGPLPVELLPRAQALLARNTELMQRIEARRTDIRSELARIPRSRPTESGAEPRFEAHA